ncbi:chemotaxis protein CheB [Halochromatium sp.]
MAMVRYRILLITDDATLGSRFRRECERQAPGLQVECEEVPELAFGQLRKSRREPGANGHLLVVDLGDSGEPGSAPSRATAGVQYLKLLAQARLLNGTPLVLLASNIEAAHQHWASASPLAVVDRAELPAAVARIRVLGAHLWPVATPAQPELSLLIVDDDPFDLENLQRLIVKANVGRWRVLTATTGRAAIEVARREHLDLVFLDYRLPDLSGAEILRILRLHWSQQSPIVISLTGAGSEQVAREMFLLGAYDYLRKELLNSVVVARYLRDVQRLKASSSLQTPTAAPAASLPEEALAEPQRAPAPSVPEQPPACVVICGSAGASDPLFALLDALDLGERAAVLVALHLPPNGDSQLATLLQLHSRQPLTMVETGDYPKAGELHLCPAGFDVGLEQGRYVLVDAHPLNAVPALDALLDTVADTYAERVTLVILSGLGHDCSHGAARVAARGGRILALDPTTTGFPAMIEAALATGQVEVTGTPSALAQQLQESL